MRRNSTDWRLRALLRTRHVSTFFQGKRHAESTTPIGTILLTDLARSNSNGARLTSAQAIIPSHSWACFLLVEDCFEEGKFLATYFIDLRSNPIVLC
jgi:hypothetical protein